MVRLFGRSLLLCALLFVAVHFAEAQNPSAGTAGAVAGHVTTDVGGTPVSGAVITVIGLSLSARTDSLGRYFLRAVPAGQQTIRIQQIGFREIKQSLTIAAGIVTAADFLLTRPVTKLDTQRVKGDNWMHKPLRLANTTKYDDFYARKVISAGGVQLTHEELEKRVNARLEEAFSSIPGVHLARRGSRYMISLPNCPEARMAVYVDGHKEYPMGEVKAPYLVMPGQYLPAPDGGPMEILQQFDLNTVEAIEIYKSVSGMPAEARGDACAALYIWTR